VVLNYQTHHVRHFLIYLTIVRGILGNNQQMGGLTRQKMRDCARKLLQEVVVSKVAFHPWGFDL
jgi:hypothetical protein